MLPQIDFPSESPAEKHQPTQRLFVLNLGLMIVVGVLASAWLLRYTELFGEFASLLALSGLFSWLAFVSKIVRDDRLKMLRDWADGSLFCSARTSVILGALLATLLAAGCFVGSVELQSFDSALRPVRMSRGRGEAGEPSGLLPGSRRREWFWTSWLRPSEVFVKLKGYPESPVDVLPWKVKRLVVPEELLLPVVLVYPGPRLMASMQLRGPRNPVSYNIRVYIDGKPWTGLTGKRVEAIKFNGYAVWIGCDEEVDIPKHALDQLQLRMNGIDDAAGKSNALQGWLNPRSGASEALPGEGSIELKLFLGEEDTTRAATGTLKKPATYLDFPLLLELEVM